MKKSILFLLFLLLFLPLVFSQDVEIWQYGKQNEDMNITQPCRNTVTGNICSPSATCYLTIFYPNGTLYDYNESMSNLVTYHTYSLSNTSVLGNYPVNWYCEDSGYYNSGKFYIQINKIGREEEKNNLTIFFIILFGFMGMFFFAWAMLTDSKNEVVFGPDDNKFLKINYGKYLKLLFYFLSYIFLWITTFWLWQFLDMYMMYDTLAGTVRYFFIIESILAAPLFIVIAIIGMVKHIADSEIVSWQKRGLPLR